MATIGRPEDYRPEYAAEAEEMVKRGATNRDLARHFGCVISTIHAWRIRHQDFSDALKLGRDEADQAVVRSLYDRAMGYSYDAVKIFMPAGAGEPVYADYTEHCPPDTTAAIFWLKNRRPDLWRDTQHREHSGNVSGLSPTELDEEEDILSRKVAAASDPSGEVAPKVPD